jgi:hypothetical protein
MIPSESMAKPATERSALDSPLIGAGAVGLPALLAYLLARRINTAGMTRAQKALASQIRNKGFAREILPKDRFRNPLLNYLQHGTNKVVVPTTTRSGKPRKIREVLFSPFQDTPEFVQGSQTLGTGAPIENILDKAREAKLLHRVLPKDVGETIRATEIPRRIRSIRSPLERASALQAWMKRRFPKGYIIKGVDESQTGGSLLTDKDDLRKVMQRSILSNRKPMPVMRTLLDRLTGMRPELTQHELERMAESARAVIMRRLPGLTGEQHLRMISKAPEEIMIQRRFPLKDLNPIDRLLTRLTTGSPPKAEMRVHTIGTRVLPTITASRHGTLSALGDVIGLRGRETREAERLVARALRRLEKTNPKYVKNRAFSFDVGLTPGGKPKIIEANPEGFSGFLSPTDQFSLPFDPLAALRSHRFVSELSGRKTVPLALARAGTAGVGGGVGYGALRALQPTPQSELPA